MLTGPTWSNQHILKDLAIQVLACRIQWHLSDPLLFASLEFSCALELLVVFVSVLNFQMQVVLWFLIVVPNTACSYIYNMLSVNISFFLPFLFHNYVTILFRGRPQFLFLAFPQTQSLCLFWDDTANYYQFFDDKKSKQKNQTRPVHNVALAADVIDITDVVDEIWAIKQKSSASQCGCVYMKFVVFQLF